MKRKCRSRRSWRRTKYVKTDLSTTSITIKLPHITNQLLLDLCGWIRAPKIPLTKTTILSTSLHLLSHYCNQLTDFVFVIALGLEIALHLSLNSSHLRLRRVVADQILLYRRRSHCCSGPLWGCCGQINLVMKPRLDSIQVFLPLIKHLGNHRNVISFLVGQLLPQAIILIQSDLVQKVFKEPFLSLIEIIFKGLTKCYRCKTNSFHCNYNAHTINAFIAINLHTILNILLSSVPFAYPFHRGIGALTYIYRFSAAVHPETKIN